MNIAQLSSQIKNTLQANDVVFAGLFGSQATNHSTQNSDYDFLVEFSAHKKHTLFHLVQLKEDLEQVLNKPVDVVTPQGLDKYIRQQVLDSIVSVYDNR